VEVVVVVVQREESVRTLEVEIEERCFRLLARCHLQTRQVRYLASVLKVIGDLRHVGVECARIVRTVLDGSCGLHFQAPADLSELAHNAAALVADSLEAFFEADAGLAMRILTRAPFVEAQASRVLEAHAPVPGQPSRPTEAGINRIAAALQRIISHAARIADGVMFLVRVPEQRVSSATSSTPI
jgi:phosphate transport system protein